jgi:glucuronokinase
MAMEFGPDHMRVVNGLETGAYRRLGTLPPGLFVAYRADAASESGAVHASIDRTDPVVRTAMQRAAAAGRAAAKAIDAGDTSALGAAMNATFEQRRAIMSLDPAHVEMIEVARANKASANYTGSGGAIIALAPDDRAADALRSIGCTIIHV